MPFYLFVNVTELTGFGEVVCDSYPTIRRLFAWFDENCKLHKLYSSVARSIHSASRPPWHNHCRRQYLAGYQISRQPLDLHNEVITLFSVWEL